MFYKNFFFSFRSFHNKCYRMNYTNNKNKKRQDNQKDAEIIGAHDSNIFSIKQIT